MSCKPLKKTDAGKWWAKSKDRHPVRRQEREYILIASEDGKSSLVYFAALDPGPSGNRAKFAIVPKGSGRNTQSLVRYVQSHRKQWLAEVQEEVAIEDFNQVWLVFDRDSFPAHKFDNAIRSAESSHYQVAWSNECFELWYLLHFKNQTTGITRKEIYKELTRLLKLPHNYEDYKGDEGLRLHKQMARDGNIITAIKRARRLHENAAEATPHDANPCTLVYKLIETLFPEYAERAAASSRARRG